jgi:hypothetical protein
MGNKEAKLLDQAPVLPIPVNNYIKEKFYINEKINIIIIFFILILIFIIFLNSKKSKWR